MYTHQCDRVPSFTTTTFRYCDNANNKKATVDLCPCACECLISIQKTLLSIGYMDIYYMPHTWFILTNVSNRLVYLFAFNLKEKRLLIIPLYNCIKSLSQKTPTYMFVEIHSKIGRDKLDSHSLLVGLMYLPLPLNCVICAY